MKCKLCGQKIKKHGFSNLLDNSENKKLVGLNKDQSICIECKTTMLNMNILHPFVKKCLHQI